MAMFKMPKKPVGRPTNRPDADTLGRLYAEHTPPEIGKMYGVSDSTVRCWILKYRREQQAAEAAKQDTVREEV